MKGGPTVICKNPCTPFGYGLSYTTFTYRNLPLTRPALPCQDQTVRITVEVENTGPVAGDEVVHHLKHIEAVVDTPSELQALNACLGSREKQTVEFILQPRQLAVVDETGPSGWNRQNPDPWGDGNLMPVAALTEPRF